MAQRRAFAVPSNPSLLLAAAVFLLLLAPAPVFALLNVDGTRNQIFVFGDLQLGYDSNIFAQEGGASDFITTGTVGVEWKRHAGVIAIDSKASLSYQHYDKFTQGNGWNPSFSVEFDKTTGRTTGALTVGATRSQRTDTTVNLLTTSWNIPVDLNVKYPINQRYYFTSDTGYLRRDYLNNPALSNYDEYNEGVDVFYIYTSKLDLLGGYRVRFSHSDAGRATDQNVTFGATGGLLPKLSGIVRAGFQNRRLENSATYNQLSLSGQLLWTATRNFSLTGSASRDFNTTAIAGSVDSLSGRLDGTYIFTRRFQVLSGLGGGRNLFLNGIEAHRRDEFFTWDVGATYSWGEHLKITATYTYLRNWSNSSVAQFDRNGFSIDISSRY